MGAWTLEEAKQHLAAWLEADIALATGQSYQMGEIKLTRADIATVKDRINFWRREVAALEKGRGSGPRVYRVIPRDR
jgi:ribosomal protein L29